MPDWPRSSARSTLQATRALAASCTLAIFMLALAAAGAQESDTGPGLRAPENESATPVRCLPEGEGYLRARLSGALSTELVWGNEGTECTGAVRPTDGGIRMRFRRPGHGEQDTLVIVFGISRLEEGRNARNVPVNVTVIREGHGEFWSTQGDDKCVLDEVRQKPILGIPHRVRSYIVVARGFCTEPARAVRGRGSILLSRFDYAGRVDYETQDEEEETETLTVRR
ncbi:MAG TPA: hypothetical protein VF161_13620 [Steroidobacteraceae bacterium]